MTGVQTQESLDQYVARIEAKRRHRAEELRSPDGWLALTGLFELKEGAQTIGSGDDQAVVLPKSAPDHLGTITLTARKVTLRLEPPSSAVTILVDEAPAQAGVEMTLKDNGGGTAKPTQVRIGSVTFFVHKYGDHYAIRVKDRENPAIREFHGFSWFAVKPDYRVRGTFVPHATPQPVQINTVINTVSEYQSPGVLKFELHGQPLQLLVTGRSGNKLSLLLRDATSGQTTYPAVRFLTVEVDADNHADIDFNTAYNPPCALTPYATCPLPPRENILPVAIEAGEQYP